METITFHVTVGKKTKDHPFWNSGFSFGYIIDGKMGKKLELTRGKTYKFIINSIGHPFYLTTDSTGGSGFPGSLMNIGGSKAIPTDKGIIIYSVHPNFPSNAFYQCGIHPKMGGFIEVKGPIFPTKIPYIEMTSSNNIDQSRDQMKNINH